MAKLNGALKRREGFRGQHLIVLPQSAIADARRNALLKGLLPTAAGYFPRAAGHYVERFGGTVDTILILYIAGRGWFRCEQNGIETEVYSGDLIYIPPNISHFYGAHSHDPWTISWVHCSGSELPLFLETLNLTLQSPTLHAPVEKLAALDFSLVYEILEDGYSAPNLLAAAAHLRKTLAELNRQRLSPTVSGRFADQKIEAALGWMRTHLDQPARLAKLAALAELSVPHFSKLFKQKTGYPPIDYFLRLKVQHACQLLDTTNLKIEQIAARVGFEDQFYFSRLFRKIMFCSPLAYRAVQKG